MSTTWRARWPPPWLGQLQQRERRQTSSCECQVTLDFTISRTEAQTFKSTRHLYKLPPSYFLSLLHTRKLCYRKDDRAMRPTYGCPENFRDCLTTPTATIPNIFMGFCSDRLLRMFLQNLKSVALPVPEIIGVPKKFGQSLDTPTLPFLKNF